MSVQALTWVLERSEARLGARLVLIAIANHADNAGENSWQSVTTIARSSRLSERQTRYALRQLEELGEIEEVGKHPRHGTHVYRLPKMAQQALLQTGAISAPAGSAGGQSASSGHEETAPEPSFRPVRKTSPSAKSPAREKPTNDSVYLASRINERWNLTTGGRLTPPALQRLVNRFGARDVEDAIRELHGFPPEEAVRSPYAYLEAMLADRLAQVPA